MSTWSTESGSVRSPRLPRTTSRDSARAKRSQHRDRPTNRSNGSQNRELASRALSVPDHQSPARGPTYTAHADAQPSKGRYVTRRGNTPVCQIPLGPPPNLQRLNPREVSRIAAGSGRRPRPPAARAQPNSTIPRFSTRPKVSNPAGVTNHTSRRHRTRCVGQGETAS